MVEKTKCNFAERFGLQTTRIIMVHHPLMTTGESAGWVQPQH